MVILGEWRCSARFSFRVPLTTASAYSYNRMTQWFSALGFIYYGLGWFELGVGHDLCRFSTELSVCLKQVLTRVWTSASDGGVCGSGCSDVMRCRNKCHIVSHFPFSPQPSLSSAVALFSVFLFLLILIMGPLRRKKHAQFQRQVPGAAPTASGLGGSALTVDPNDGKLIPTLDLDTDVAPGGGFSTAPQLASGITPTITLSPTAIPVLTSSPESSDTSSISASSSTAAPISVSTVVGSCVGAFIGALALVCLGLWFYRRYHHSLKAQYRTKGHGPVDSRSNIQRRLSRRESWDKLEVRNLDNKHAGRTNTEESVGPMEKLTMFKKSPSVRTAHTHFEEEPGQFEMSDPFSHQFSFSNNDQENTSIPTSKSFMASNTWNNVKGSFLSARTQPEHLPGSMSPSLSMAIPTPPVTASPHYHWESAEIINMEGHSADTADPFADENQLVDPEKRKSYGNPFFSAQRDVPRRRSRSNSLPSKASGISRVGSISESLASSVHIPVPKVDKGKGKAIDPFDDQNVFKSYSGSASHPTIISLPTVVPTHPVYNSPAVPSQPIVVVHNVSPSTSSVASNEHAMASLIAALDGAATEEEVQARLRINSVHSTTSNYSDCTEGFDVSKDFPLPPPTPVHSTSTLESFVTAESDQTVKTR